MNHNFTWCKGFGLFFLLCFSVFQVNAQTQIGEITAASTTCFLSFDICNGDTITLQPSNTVDYTNFTWYYGSADPGNEISAVDLAQNVVYFSNDTIKVVMSGGTYILSGEFNTPSGCATKNDTIALNFFDVPDLATVPDTICSTALDSTQLTSLVSDANGATSGSGTMAWYTSLADATAESGALASTMVSPSMTQMYYVRKNSGNAGGCFDIDSVQVVVSCMSIGNIVWYDTDNDATIDGGEPIIAGVEVELFHDANGNGTLEAGEQVAIAKDTTDGSGLYLFEGLSEGNYFVGIPETEFDPGEPLHNLLSSQTTRSLTGATSELTAAAPESSASDMDDNGTYQTSGFYTKGVLTSVVMLEYLDEPTLENPDNSTVADGNGNLTVDFGFYGLSLGSLVFMDVANDGTFNSGTDMGIAGVTVNLYSGDGATLIASSITDANGNYLFTNLPEGAYVVAVDTSAAALDGKFSSDDIATSSTPTAEDNDDNGVNYTAMDIRSNVVTLDAGNGSTGESDQSLTATPGMGNPATTSNAISPDQNSELHVDFGFKSDCPTISNPTATVTICVDSTNADLIVQTNQNAANSIRFVRFDDVQSGADMYTGGTDLETVTPVGSGIPYTANYTFDTNDFPNAGATPDTFYVYAVLDPAPADMTCRPNELIMVIVNPNPQATPASLTLCETTAGGGTADFMLSNATSDVENGQTGVTVTYHATAAEALSGMNAITMSGAVSDGTVVYARVENSYGCADTAQVTLNVNLKPVFTLAIPTTCPGNNPEIMLTLGAGADVDPQVAVNGGVAFAFSTLGGSNLTTANGVVVGGMNTVVLTNANTCTNTQTIASPAFDPNVCLPVTIIRN